MRLHRFFSDETVSSKKELAVSRLAHQVSKVFRLKTGDRAIIFDGSGFDYECVAIDPSAGSFRVLSSSASRYMPPRRAYLFAAVVKKDKFEFIVEKATELGATDVVPVIAERTEKKGLNAERLKMIAREAAEQSGRGDLPIVHPMKSLAEAIELAKDQKTETVAFHTDAPLLDGETAAMYADKTKPLAVFIGPEGGWSEKEIDMFHGSGVAVYSFGTQVLRAETAVIAALSKVLL